MRLLRPLTTAKGRRLLAVLTGIACGAALAASASGTRTSHASPGAYVPANLLAAARTNPDGTFRVILQGARAVPAVRRSGATLERRLHAVSGASAAVTGRQLVGLASTKGVAAITLDRPVRLTDDGEDDSGSFWSNQQWPYAVRAQRDWRRAAKGKLAPPAIAVVDSGIQANRADFADGANVLTQVTIVNTGTQNSPGDGYGHGTFVAGL